MIAYAEDADGRVVKGVEGTVTPTRQGEADAVVLRNHSSYLFPKVGDNVELWWKVDGVDYKMVASFVAKQEPGKRCAALVRLRVDSDADEPVEAVGEPV